MAKKRGNGEGSIYRRKDGRWVGQYLVYTAKGPKYKYIYGKTRQAVAEKLTRAMADRDVGLVFDTGSLTLSNYLDRWLLHIRDTVRQRTWERYEQMVRVHLKPVTSPISFALLFTCKTPTFRSTPGRIRTCDPRIRSPKTYVLACSSVSGISPYSRGF